MFMSESKLFWFFMGGVSSLALIILWTSLEGANKNKKRKSDDPTYRKVRGLIDEADEMLDILKAIGKIDK
jgi:ABC-type Fe3+-citrate transport system substrate-binding protein